MNLSTTGLTLAASTAIDLHLHTTYSHGHWTPEQLLDYLAGEQFGLAAVTDHDRADTAAALQALALDKGLPVLVGVEMSSTWKGEFVDLLCFGFDPAQDALTDLAQDLVRRQQDNSRQVFENLQRQGFALPPEALPGILAVHNVEQPFAIVDLLKERGYGESDPSAGKIVFEAGCALLANEPAAVVDAAHRSGAVCLLAHPGRGEGFVNFDTALLDEFRQVAPVDGLEANYPLHTPAQTEMYREYARRHHLLTSAGSDSHSPAKPPVKYPADLCRELLERVGIQVA